MKTLSELRQERGALVEQMRKILDTATDEKRAMTAEEAARFDQCDLEQGRLGERIAREDPTARGGRLYAGREGLADLRRELESRTTDSGLRPMPMDRGRAFRDRGPGEVRVLAPSESLRDHVDADLPDGIRPHELSFGRALRGIVTGSWRGAEAEQRVMGTAVAGGQFLVPSILSATVIDLARAQTRVVQAGAVTVPMDAPELGLARVSKDPTAQWKGENQPGTVSDVELEKVTLRARTLMAVVKMSVELFEDGQNIGRVVEDALAAALALELDRAALRGGQTVGPIEPVGIRYTSGVQLVAVNGTLSGGFDKYAEAFEKIQTSNGPAEGISVIFHPREQARIDKYKDGQGNPLTPPDSWRAMKKFATTSIPVILGGGANETEIYIGAFAELMLGMRTELTIEASRQAADSGDSAFRNLQVWIRAYLRGDVALQREKFHVVLTGVQP